MALDLDLGGIFVQNDTFDYDSYEYEEDCKPSSGAHFESVFIPVLYSVALVVGLLGNGLLLVVLAEKRRTWSVTDTFILHLGVADILLLLTLPFWAVQAAQEEGWSLGTVLCKFTGTMFNINFYCGIFLLACISLDRYLSIVHATQMFSRRKPWLVQASCLSIWFVSVLLSLPDWVFLEVVKDGKVVCSHNFVLDSQTVSGWRLASRLLYHTVGFLLPSAVLLLCCSCSLLQLQRGSLAPPRQRAVRVILALVVAFFLCWLPYNITLIVDTFQNNKAPEKPADVSCRTNRTSLQNSLIVTSALGCFHACVNPLVFLGLCRNFRKRLLELMRRIRGMKDTPADCKGSLWELGVGEEVLPGQPHEKVVLNQLTSPEPQMQSSQSR